MLIDWFTVGAQAFNFLILVWLMKRYLYQPIRLAIDAREQRVAAELADAASKQAEAQRQRDEFQHKNEAFDQQRAALMKQAAETADAEARRLLDQATKDADALGVKLRASAQSEVLALSQTLGRTTQQEVFSITRKVLADLATTTLEERACGEFVRRVRALEGEDLATLASALKRASEPAVVRSAFELPAAQRQAITDAIHERFAVDYEARFETAPDLVAGIELAVNGQKVAWTIAAYLKSLEERVADLVGDRDKPQAKEAHASPLIQDPGPAAAKPVAQPS